MKDINLRDILWTMTGRTLEMEALKERAMDMIAIRLRATEA